MGVRICEGRKRGGWIRAAGKRCRVVILLCVHGESGPGGGMLAGLQA